MASSVSVALLVFALISFASCLPPNSPAVARARVAPRESRDLQGAESYYGGFGGFGYGGFGYGYGYGYPYYGGFYGGYYPYFGGYYF